MRHFSEDDPELDLVPLSEVDEEDSSSPEEEHDRYEVVVCFRVRAGDPDVVEDSMSDLICEAVERLAKRYAKDIKILDYTLDSVEPAEID